MKSDKKRSPYSIMIRLAFILAVVAAVCWVAVEGINAYNQNALAQKIKAANERNKELETQYNIAKADYESVTRTGQNPSWPEVPQEGWVISELASYALESRLSETVAREDLLVGGLVLVNHWHTIPTDMPTEGIKSVREWTNSRVPIRDNNIKLYEKAALAVDDMLIAAGILELKDYIIQEAYRSMEEQTTYFDDKVEALRKRNDKLSEDVLRREASKEVNAPGTSEYQTGFSFWMKLYNRNDASITGTPFQESQQGQWFTQNAWKYGIIFRFPTAEFPTTETIDKSYKTGNSGKHNIYRYVGVAHSTAMMILDMCLEEYIEYLIKVPHIAIYQDGVLKYEIYRQAYEGGSATIGIPAAVTSYVASIDNMGGVVTAYHYD